MSMPATSTPKPPLLTYVVAVFIFCGVVLVAIIIYQSVFAKTNRSAQKLNVSKGDTYHSLLVAKPWQEHALASSFATRLYIKFYANDTLHQGVYDIPAGASLKEVVEILGKGADVAMVKVQIIEGKTTKDLYHILKNTEGIRLETLTPKADGYSWADVQRDNEAVAKALNIHAPNNNLEGWFAPDTYFFSQATSDTVILKHLYKIQKDRLDKAWQTRAENLPYKDPYEALIMASIIEKETGIKSERNDVSAVFVNRLRQNMRLQTDPTIIYGLFDRYDGKIYKSNISEKNDYNTYQMGGLPLTPIALPSLESIKATMHPSDVPYIYFVATGTGGHTFSVTLDEHNKAVEQYRAAIATQNQNNTNQADKAE